MIEVATDGSSLGNPGDSAWAWYVTNNRWRSGFIGRGTNNRAELMAIREAALDIPLRLDVLCLADSQYAIQCLTRGRGGFLSAWERNGKLERGLVANSELIKETLAAIEARQGGWVFEWVRGHCGHPLNTEADRLANTAAGSKAKPDTNYGPGWSISKKRSSHR